MSSHPDLEARTVAAAVVRYLRAHPDAADTIEGAARWWLARPPDEDAMARAMTLLVSGSLVERHVLPDGTVVFRGGRVLAASRRTKKYES